MLLEEIGHFVDAKINQTDSAGDEGAIFAALVQGQNLDVETLRVLKAEDDHSIITLNNQQIDRSTKTERYQLLHDVYSKIYDYKKSIKEASDPRYLLDKFFGNLSIKEYRNLLRTGTLYLVIDKPLTKVYPEIHENTEDYILNNKIIPSNTSNYQIRGKNGRKKPNKSSILSENFGIN